MPTLSSTDLSVSETLELGDASRYGRNFVVKRGSYTYTWTINQRDYVKAICYYREAYFKSCSSSDKAKACNKMAELYEIGGYQLTKNLKYAVTLYHHAYNFSSSYGKSGLNGIYYRANADELLTIGYLFNAGNAGYPYYGELSLHYFNNSAYKNKKVTLSIKPDKKEALRWYEKAKNKGSGQAYQKIGELYRDGGNGITKDLLKAAIYFQQALDKGVWAKGNRDTVLYYYCNASQLLDMGRYYFKGERGIKRNDTEALRCYRKILDRMSNEYRRYYRYLMLGKGIPNLQALKLADKKGFYIYHDTNKTTYALVVHDATKKETINLTQVDKNNIVSNIHWPDAVLERGYIEHTFNAKFYYLLGLKKQCNSRMMLKAGEPDLKELKVSDEEGIYFYKNKTQDECLAKVVGSNSKKLWNITALNNNVQDIEKVIKREFRKRQNLEDQMRGGYNPSKYIPSEFPENIAGLITEHCKQGPAKNQQPENSAKQYKHYLLMQQRVIDHYGFYMLFKTGRPNLEELGRSTARRIYLYQDQSEVYAFIVHGDATEILNLSRLCDKLLDEDHVFHRLKWPDIPDANMSVVKEDQIPSKKFSPWFRQRGWNASNSREYREIKLDAELIALIEENCQRVLPDLKKDNFPKRGIYLYKNNEGTQALVMHDDSQETLNLTLLDKHNTLKQLLWPRTQLKRQYLKTAFDRDCINLLTRTTGYDHYILFTEESNNGDSLKTQDLPRKGIYFYRSYYSHYRYSICALIVNDKGEGVINISHLKKSISDIVNTFNSEYDKYQNCLKDRYLKEAFPTALTNLITAHCRLVEGIQAYQGMGQVYEYGGGYGVKQDPIKAAVYYQKAIDGGVISAKKYRDEMLEDVDAECLLNIGEYYFKGDAQEKVTKDYNEALHCYGKAVKKNLKKAYQKQGLIYELGGHGIQQDLLIAIRCYQRAIDAGIEAAKLDKKRILEEKADASQLITMGDYYAKGDKDNDIKQDYVQALDCYNKALAQGSKEAHQRIGRLHEHGSGMKKDLLHAFVRYQKSVDQDFAQAKEDKKRILSQLPGSDLLKVGDKYYQGTEVKQDYFSAFKWYQHAQEKEEHEAHLRLGLLYRKGQGIDKNLPQAVVHYQLAIDHGLEAGKKEKGVILEQASIADLLVIGDYYFMGENVKKNYKEALRWYQKAEDKGANKNDVNKRRAKIYATGDDSVAKNYLKAVRFYQKVLTQDNQDKEAQKGIDGIWYAADIDSDTLCHVGSFYDEDQKLPHKAIRWFVQAIKKASNHALSYYKLGYLFLNQSKLTLTYFSQHPEQIADEKMRGLIERNKESDSKHDINWPVVIAIQLLQQSKDCGYSQANNKMEQIFAEANYSDKTYLTIAAMYACGKWVYALGQPVSRDDVQANGWYDKLYALTNKDIGDGVGLPKTYSQKFEKEEKEDIQALESSTVLPKQSNNKLNKVIKKSSPSQQKKSKVSSNAKKLLPMPLLSPTSSLSSLSDNEVKEDRETQMPFVNKTGSKQSLSSTANVNDSLVSNKPQSKTLLNKLFMQEWVIENNNSQEQKEDIDEHHNKIATFKSFEKLPDMIPTLDNPPVFYHPSLPFQQGIYKGMLKSDSLPNGFGYFSSERFGTSQTYVGQWQQGQRQGKGQFVKDYQHPQDQSREGLIFYGLFEKDQWRDGFLTRNISLKSGVACRLEGKVSQGQFSGWGRITIEQEQQPIKYIVGEWKADRLTPYSNGVDDLAGAFQRCRQEFRDTLRYNSTSQDYSIETQRQFLYYLFTFSESQKTAEGFLTAICETRVIPGKLKQKAANVLSLYQLDKELQNYCLNPHLEESVSFLNYRYRLEDEKAFLLGNSDVNNENSLTQALNRYISRLKKTHNDHKTIDRLFKYSDKTQKKKGVWQQILGVNNGFIKLIGRLDNEQRTALIERYLKDKISLTSNDMSEYAIYCVDINCDVYYAFYDNCNILKPILSTQNNPSLPAVNELNTKPVVQDENLKKSASMKFSTVENNEHNKQDEEEKLDQEPEVNPVPNTNEPVDNYLMLRIHPILIKHYESLLSLMQPWKQYPINPKVAQKLFNQTKEDINKISIVALANDLWQLPLDAIVKLFQEARVEKDLTDMITIYQRNLKQQDQLHQFTEIAKVNKTVLDICRYIEQASVLLKDTDLIAQPIVINASEASHQEIPSSKLLGPKDSGNNPQKHDNKKDKPTITASKKIILSKQTIHRQLQLIKKVMQKTNNMDNLLDRCYSYNKSVTKLANVLYKKFIHYPIFSDRIVEFFEQIDALFLAIIDQLPSDNTELLNRAVTTIHHLNNFLIPLSNRLALWDWYVEKTHIVNIKTHQDFFEKPGSQQSPIYKVIKSFTPLTIKQSIKPHSLEASNTYYHYGLEVMSELLATVHCRSEQNSMDKSKQEQLESMTKILVAVSESLEELIKQSDYESLDQFKKEYLTPFLKLKHCKSDYISQQVRVIKLYFRFCKKTKEITPQKALALYQQENKQSNKELVRELGKLYDKYNKSFQSYFRQMHQGETLETLITEIKSLAETKKSQYSLADSIIHIISGLSVVLSLTASEFLQDVERQEKVVHVLKNNASTNKEVSAHSEKYLLQPHCIQILGIFNLLNMADKTKVPKDFDQYVMSIPNHITQVLTGQGKSWILALLAGFFSLFDYKVTVACYSAYLSKRDAQDFHRHFGLLNIEDKVTYATFQQLCEHTLTHENTTLRQMVSHIMQGKPGGISKKAYHDRGKKHILLIDEIDVLLSQFFYRINILSRIYNEQLANLQVKIWQKFTQGKTRVAITDYVNDTFKHWQKNKKIIAHWDNFGQLFYDALMKMVHTAAHIYANMHPLVYSDKVAQLNQDNFKLTPDKKLLVKDKTDGKYKANLSYGYYNSFYYIKFIMSQSINSKEAATRTVREKGCFGYFYISCGRISYTSLIMGSKQKTLGVTGSLKSTKENQSLLSKEDNLLLQRLHIKKHSYFPSFFGKDKLVFDGKNDCYLSKNSEEQYKRIKTIVEKMMTRNRSVLIFFNSEEKLKAFSKNFHNHYGQTYIISSNYTSLDSNKVTQKDINLLIDSEHAGCHKNVTLLMAEFGRGTDFKADATVNAAGGMVVIQTFFSLDIKEEVQIKGRTSRNGAPGHYKLELDMNALKKQFGEKVIGTHTDYDILSALRLKKMDDKENCDHLNNNIKIYTQETQRTITFFKNVVNKIDKKDTADVLPTVSQLLKI